jgi:hypothetical protein
MNGPFVKEKIRTKKPMLAAKSKSMLTGLVENAKAQNIIHPPHVNRTGIYVTYQCQSSEYYTPSSCKQVRYICYITLPKFRILYTLM